MFEGLETPSTKAWFRAVDWLRGLYFQENSYWNLEIDYWNWNWKVKHQHQADCRGPRRQTASQTYIEPRMHQWHSDMTEGHWRCSGPEKNTFKSKVSAGGNDNDIFSFYHEKQRGNWNQWIILLVGQSYVTWIISLLSELLSFNCLNRDYCSKEEEHLLM